MGEREVGGVLECLAPFFRQSHLLGLFVEAVEIALIVALCRIAPQAVEVSLRFQREAIVLAAGTALDGPIAAIAVPAHGGEVLQDTPAQVIHHLVQFISELLGVQLLRTPGPPGMVEAFPTAPEVDADMANGSQFSSLSGVWA